MLGVNPHPGITSAGFIDIRTCPDIETQYFLLIALSIAALSYFQSIINALPGTVAGIEERDALTPVYTSFAFVGTAPLVLFGLAGIFAVVPWWWHFVWGLWLVLLPLFFLRAQVFVRRAVGSLRVRESLSQLRARRIANHGNAAICQAIARRAVVEFTYDGATRIVEPHAHGRSIEGNEVMRGFQTSDPSQSDGSIAWGLYEVSKISGLRETGATFSSNRSNYNPNEEGMGVIHCHV
ncbi:MAG: hypothetical protein AAB417_00500 [Patescibacteria group bacterium]